MSSGRAHVGGCREALTSRTTASTSWALEPGEASQAGHTKQRGTAPAAGPQLWCGAGGTQRPPPKRQEEKHVRSAVA